MKYKCTIYKLVLGGALIGGALFVSLNFARGYDQQNTHPALTDEAVDFYNLSFPSNRLTENDKKWLIKGSIDEDTAPRPVNHFYDPVYNQGWLGYTSSKVWAYSSEKQAAFLGGKSQTAGFAQFFIDEELSADDYSYQRALYDYAVGDRKRAMVAMGHIMHLLEDANVPDHTRNDTHLPWAGTESPYEQEMAKWSPGNLDIASKIFASGVKPILSGGLGDYFDKIAEYSNGYFFSQDTINTLRYNRPNLNKTKKFFINGEERLFALGQDKNGQEFKLALLKTKLVRNLIEIKEATLVNPSIGTIILDDYWSRLSKDFIPLGAGALKLFLGQAELVEREYAKNQRVTLTPSPISGILGLLGVSGQGEPQPAFDPALIDSILEGSAVAANDVSSSLTSSATSSPTPSATPLTSSVAPLTPSVTPLTPSVTPLTSLAPSPTPLLTLTPTPSATLTSTPTPTPNSGGSGGGATSTPTPIPTPTPTPSPSSSPTPSSTPTPSPSSTPIPTPSPSVTPTPSPTPTPTPEPVPSGTKVVINEIAWMGTATSSDDEWLELYNITSKSVDLSGWRFHSLTGDDPSPNIVFASKSIEPFGFFLLERTNDTTVSDISADQVYTGALSNSGEVLELRDKNGDLQDLVSKSADGWYAGKNDGKYTMERINPTKVGDNPANWATNNGVTVNGHDAAGNPINGTPRARNSVYVSQKPTTITNLAADSSSFFGQIKLTWSAPKDDDDPQSNLKYDLRYATQSFATDADWENASMVASPSMPSQVADYGQPQSSSFTIFGYNRDYYFAIKTTDGSSWSEISNQPEYTIKPAVSDESLAFIGPASPSIKWGFQPPDASRVPPYARFVNQPALGPDGTIYFGAPNDFTGKPRLYAVNPDGAEKWHYELAFGVPSTPTAAADGSVYFGSDDQSADMTAANADSTQRWVNQISSRVYNVIIDGEGNIYFLANNHGAISVTKLSPAGGLLWSTTNNPQFSMAFKPAIGPEGDIYLGTYDGVPNFYRLRSSDGTIVWNKRVDSSSSFWTFDPVYDKESGRFYASVRDFGEILDFDTTAGGAINRTMFEYSAKPTTKTAVLNDLLVLGVDFSWINPASGSAVYALNKSDKSIAWTFPVDSRVNKEIVVDADGNLYFATHNGLVYSLDSAGEERWVLDLGASTGLYPILGENAVFMGVGGAGGGKLVKIADY